MPASTKKLQHTKWDPALRVGVLAGYKLRPGLHWSHEYLVWGLADFVGLQLAEVSSSITHRLRSSHVAGRVRLRENVVTLPLKAAHDEALATLRGLQAPLQGRWGP